MGRGGHNRLPDRVKAQRGTLRAGRKGQGRKLEVARVPNPPADLNEAERRIWLQLKAEVELIGTYTRSTRTAFEIMVRSVACAFSARDAAPSARAKLLSGATAALATFGLTAASSERVPSAPPPVGDEERRLAGLLE